MSEPRGLLGYIKDMTSLPGEGAAIFAKQWKSLTEADKADLLSWAHAQDDTHVYIVKPAS